MGIAHSPLSATGEKERKMKTRTGLMLKWRKFRAYIIWRMAKLLRVPVSIDFAVFYEYGDIKRRGKLLIDGVLVSCSGKRSSGSIVNGVLNQTVFGIKG